MPSAKKSAKRGDQPKETKKSAKRAKKTETSEENVNYMKRGNVAKDLPCELFITMGYNWPCVGCFYLGRFSRAELLSKPKDFLFREYDRASDAYWEDVKGKPFPRFEWSDERHCIFVYKSGAGVNVGALMDPNAEKHELASFTSFKDFEAWLAE